MPSRATNEMIDQALRLQEMQRLNVRITEDEITDSYNNFARSNQSVHRAAERYPRPVRRHP